MAEIKDYSTTAGNNNAASPNGMPENMAPSGVNDSWREGTARLKRWYEDISAVNTLGGGTTAYTLAASRAISAYAAGDVFVAVCNSTNTGAPTLNVDSVGAKPIVTTSQTALEAGQLVADGIYSFAYDANNDTFICMNPTSLSAYEKLASGTFSATASLSVTNLSSTYFAYELIFAGVLPSSNNVALRLRLQSDSGASSYAWAQAQDTETENGNDVGDAADSEIELYRATGSGAGEQISGSIKIYNPSDSNITNVTFQACGQNNGPFFQHSVGGGQRQTAGAVTSFELAFESGNIASGSYVLYGMRA